MESTKMPLLWESSPTQSGIDIQSAHYGPRPTLPMHRLPVFPVTREPDAGLDCRRGAGADS